MKILSTALIICALFGCTAKQQSRPLPPYSTSFTKEELAKLKPCSKDRSFDWSNLKAKYRARIDLMRSKGIVPIFDIESSFGDSPPVISKIFSGGQGEPNVNGFEHLVLLDKLVDILGIAVVALSPELHFRKSLREPENSMSKFQCINFNAIDLGFSWYLPVPAAGRISFMKKLGIWNLMLQEALTAQMPMLGEYFFRHYPSNIDFQYPDKKLSFEIDTPIDGPEGEELFQFSQNHNIPFQIHYEVEDTLLPALERQLKKHPGAKVIWAHFGRVRMPELSTVYSPQYIEKMINTFPNLYFDVSEAYRLGQYPNSSGPYESQLYNDDRKHLKPEWKQIIDLYPWRFLAAFDFGGNRMFEKAIRMKVGNIRFILSELEPASREIVAYKAAWKLLFREEYSKNSQEPKALKPSH